jgi:hypothetical protein
VRRIVCGSGWRSVFSAAIAESRASERDALVVSLLAAARLLAGDLPAAHVILAHLPATPAALDHWCGHLPGGGPLTHSVRLCRYRVL